MYGYVYKTTNLINGKVYIGAHTSSKFDPHYYGSSGDLLKDISELNKYNFKVEVLKECFSKDELMRCEKEIISEYLLSDVDSYNKNLTNFGVSHRDYTRENNPFYQGEFTEEVISHLSEVRKNLRWINDGKVETTVPSESVIDYLDNGWNLGRLEESAKFTRDHSGDIWITNGKSDHLINLEVAEEYYQLGFWKGRSSGGQPFKKGDIFVTNGVINKRIKPDKLNDYISQGFYRGITR